MRIAFLGDIALFGKNTKDAGNWQVRFAEVKSILDTCDYIVGNLETPLTEYGKTIGGKSAYIKGKPEDAYILKYLGFTHVSLANNHMFDYCEKGLLDTIECLDNNKIGWFGINGKTAILDNSVSLMGYCCYSTNAVGLERTGMYINLLDPKIMQDDINKSINQGLLPVLSCHWGEEHVHYPDYNHIAVARKLAEKNRIVIIGHHPHVIQGNENIENSIIHYSLGNFCFDDVYTPKSEKPLIKLSKDNQESYILIFDIENGAVKTQSIIPFSFAGGLYKIDVSLQGKIKKWSAELADNKDYYISRRKKLLAEYISSRKSNRDINWYLKRLNIESVKMIIRAKHDAKRFEQIIKQSK